MSSQANLGQIPKWDVADRLRKSLDVTGISVSEMARHLGVSRNTVGNYLNRRTAPDKRTLMVWAIKTGLPLKWIQTGESDGPEGPDEGSELPRLDSNQEPAVYRSMQVTGPFHHDSVTRAA